MRKRGRVIFVFFALSLILVGPEWGMAQFQAPIVVQLAPAESSFGFGLASGDVNGDGVADLLVGAVLADVEGKANAGRVFVFFGGAPFEISPDVILHAPMPEREARFGWAIALADLNRDGWTDILVSALFANGGAQRGTGKVYFFFGGPSLDAQADGELPLPSLNPLARFGWTLAAGDLNGDGWTDVLVGAENAKVGARDQAGQVFVYEGGPSFPNLPRVLQSPAPQRGAAFGYAVAVGDLNADGHDDVLVGAPNEDIGSVQNAGRAYLFLGGLPFDLTADAMLQQPVPKRRSGFGQALAIADVTGDGIADALIGVPHPNFVESLFTATSDPGEVHLFFGAQPFDVTADLTLRAPTPAQNDGFGTTLAVGRAGILVGAQAVHQGSVTGRAYFFAGGSALDAVAEAAFQASPPDPGGQFSVALALGDVNGDGRDDALIGSVNPGTLGLPRGPGRVYVFPAV
jgi:hypothetical protein